ncbi:MAG: hypothetical protein AAGD13_19520 [Pseudomonadota bacterium]
MTKRIEKTGLPGAEDLRDGDLDAIQGGASDLEMGKMLNKKKLDLAKMPDGGAPAAKKSSCPATPASPHSYNRFGFKTR